jgi:hypothetical protein
VASKRLCDELRAGDNRVVSSAKHHFVTAAYLRGMLLAGDSRLWVYERNKRSAFRNIPKNIAHRRGYYSIVRPDGSEDDKLENVLAINIEGPGIPVLRKLSSGNKQLKWEEIAFGASLIAMQELRVPSMREQLASAMIGIQEQMINFSLSVPGYVERTLKELRERGENAHDLSADDLRESVRSGKVKLQAHPEASLKAIGYMLPTLIEFYSQMKWTVLVSSSQAFLTSDVPVCRRYPQSPHLGAGLLNPDIEVYFPISHDRVLQLTHDRVKMERLDELERQGRKREWNRLHERVPEIAYRDVGRERAIEINALIIERACRWVYAPTSIESITDLFVGEPKNVRMDVDFVGGPNLIRLRSRLL